MIFFGCFSGFQPLYWQYVGLLSPDIAWVGSYTVVSILQMVTRNGSSIWPTGASPSSRSITSGLQWSAASIIVGWQTPWLACKWRLLETKTGMQKVENAWVPTTLTNHQWACCGITRAYGSSLTWLLMPPFWFLCCTGRWFLVGRQAVWMWLPICWTLFSWQQTLCSVQLLWEFSMLFTLWYLVSVTYCWLWSFGQRMVPMLVVNLTFTHT